VTLKSTLQQHFPGEITIDVEGLSGDCVLASLGGDFADRLGAALSDAEYDLIIILGGTNDLAYKMEDGLQGATEIFEQGLKPLYDFVLKTTKSSLVLMTVPMRSVDVSQASWSRSARENREHLNHLILEWAEQEKRAYSMDLSTMVPFPIPIASRRDDDDEDNQFGEGSFWSPDGLHMSEEGYGKVGELLGETIQGLLETADD
jgi:lysophospholipase L1-like esterase